jgi:hypothetical protein
MRGWVGGDGGAGNNDEGLGAEAGRGWVGQGTKYGYAGKAPLGAVFQDATPSIEIVRRGLHGPHRPDI